ncbi:MAG: ABC transporter substrate-binding protein [Fusobacteriota bacterium]
MKKMLIVLGVLISLISYSEEKVKIGYFLTDSTDERFYKILVDFADEAAKDLGVQLDIYSANDNAHKMLEQVKDAINNGTDAIMVINFKKIGREIIKEAEKAKVPVLFQNSGILKDDFSYPREKYKYYIGEILPDDVQVGYDLAEQLIKIAKVKYNGELNMIGLQGFHATESSTTRVTGLKNAMKKYKEVDLKQVTTGDWDDDVAKRKFLRMKDRYSDVQIVWAANDDMALGVLSGAKEIGMIPGEDIFIGGVDWTDDAIDAVKKGELVTTIGGHFMEAAWGVILLHDYLKGYDFKKGGVIKNTDMYALTKDNYEDMKLVLDKENWSTIDFKRFSRVYNEDLEQHNFKIEKIIEQLSSK